ncbi:MAG: helical backbone metal receptor [Candidatus Bathyarchaeota archaeon]|nr:helical backbone metal receptor [Candidatus Bathyarchaeota archaeon]MCX8176686.1 helical backbone metal receptor [Candidatus Bathyarchaeota archaeon]MDW8193213.1 helical backbone metal receptor [Nitrososphaerota archaeon]
MGKTYIILTVTAIIAIVAISMIFTYKPQSTFTENIESIPETQSSQQHTAIQETQSAEVGESAGTQRVNASYENRVQGLLSVVDWQGANVTLKRPAETVVSLSSGMTELIYALGCGHKIIGRDSYSDYPPDVLGKPVVAPHAYNPPLEKILELKPDLLVSNTVLVYDNNETRKILEHAGIAVYVDETSSPRRVKECIRNIGTLLGAEKRAQKLIEFIEYYEKLIETRITKLSESEKPKVYFEIFREWNTAAKGSIAHDLLEFVGAINIAANLSTPYPIVNPEFVIDKNPDIIIRMKMSWDLDYPELYHKLRTRPELQSVNAVINDKIFLYDPNIMQGVRYPVGLLYWAKWLHPRLFSDINPETVHAQLVQEFFGLQLEKIYAYP